jgi:hypothetical protein
MDGSDLKKILYAWLLVPLTALDWCIAWRWVPERAVMKVGSDGQPRAWALRWDAMMFDIKLLSGCLLFITAIGFLIAFQKPWKASWGAWIVLLSGGFIFLLLNGVLWLTQVR